MKSIRANRAGIAVIAAFFSVVSTGIAQPAAGPLTVQGLDQFAVVGVRSRAMGGTSTASANDASALFSNPAALSQLTSFEIRAGGLLGVTNRSQSQEWVAFRPLPGLSILFEGLTGTVIPPADTTLGPWERLQTPYDNLTPAWERNSSGGQPLSLVAALPLTFESVNMSAGFGVAQAINLDEYYQNNNAMSPYLGQQRPDPHLITEPNDTLHVQWYQYTRMREGSVYGITPGLSFTVFSGLSIGGSATFLTGSSDDFEHRVERGHINIDIQRGETQNFMLDTVYYTLTKAGTSTYRGSMFNFGLHFQQEKYSVGLSVRPRMTVTRTWEREVRSVDTTRQGFPVRIDSLTTRNYLESGRDDLTFPLSFALGIMLTPTARWKIAFDYEYRKLADVTLKSTSTDSVSRPWVNNKGGIRLGAEFLATDWLALRGGYRDDVQAFAPDGAAVIGEPAVGGVYSAGVGLTIENILVDFAYEYARLKYQDIYQSNVNYTAAHRHRYMLEIAYRL